MPVAHQRQRRLMPPEYQAPATLNQANPVQNTWYELLPTTTNCRVYFICVNIEDTDEELECQVTIDGETIQGISQPCVHSTTYDYFLVPNAITRVDVMMRNTQTINRYANQSFILEGRSIKIEVRKTTNNGAGNLTGIVIYNRYTETDV